MTCHVAIHDTATMHNRLIDFWSPRWNKHSDIPTSHWNHIADFARVHMQFEPSELPPITAHDFRGAYKSNAATGPCGWTLQDLRHMTDTQVSAVVDLFSAIEDGVPLLAQWCIGLLHFLQKRASSSTVDGFRPITVTSFFLPHLCWNPVWSEPCTALHQSKQVSVQFCAGPSSF